MSNDCCHLFGKPCHDICFTSGTGHIMWEITSSKEKCDNYRAEQPNRGHLSARPLAGRCGALSRRHTTGTRHSSWPRGTHTQRSQGPPTQPSPPSLWSTTPRSATSLALALSPTLATVQSTPNLFETVSECSTLCHSPILQFIVLTSVIIPLNVNWSPDYRFAHSTHHVNAIFSTN